MVTEETKFERELELFRKECEGAAQFFFGYLAIHEVAKRRAAVWELLNRNAMFWNTATGAMQTAAIIAIGRVFDQGSPHNIDRVLKLAQDSPSIFSRASLGRRKQGGAREAPSWLGDYLERAYVPVPSDFRRLRAHVKKRRRIYEANYRDLRHKVYAHCLVANDSEVEPIVAKTSIRELERLLLFLLRFYESMWHLFMNGNKPTLRRLRCSVNPAGRLSLPRTSSSGVHRSMVREAEQVLVRAAAQQGTQPTAQRRKRAAADA
jgi:AbiU2